MIHTHTYTHTHTHLVSPQPYQDIPGFLGWTWNYLGIPLVTAYTSLIPGFSLERLYKREEGGHAQFFFFYIYFFITQAMPSSPYIYKNTLVETLAVFIVLWRCVWLGL